MVYGIVVFGCIQPIQQYMSLIFFLFPIRVLESSQTDSDSYNGAVRENYTWSQDFADLEIKVPVSKEVVKGRQVTCIRLLMSDVRAVLPVEGDTD